MPIRLAVLVSCLAMVAACSDSSGTTTSPPTTTEATVGTTTPAPTTSDGNDPNTVETTVAPATTAPGFSFPEFTIVERTEDDVLVVAVPPGTYTDLDLQNLVGEMVERFAPVNGLHIIDDLAATQLVLADSVSAEEQALLDLHYFLRLEDGFRMVYLGPFAEVGEVILGS
ncbi:MAG: hypothetical protein OES13_03150 [Acidimicrobiia bacterium]|nr:hypothetical protein [Acidimicrobiia bacterium]